MNWHQKTVFYKLAHLILNEVEVSPKAKEASEVVQCERKGGRIFLEWAVDFDKCIPEEAKSALDRYYLINGNDYPPPPRELKAPMRTLWKRVSERRLEGTGTMIREALWGKLPQKAEEKIFVEN